MGEAKEEKTPREYEWMVCDYIFLLFSIGYFVNLYSFRQVRPCMIYKDEYDDCTSVKARFHQYFIFGETLDCSQWKTDYRNCYQWQKHKSEEAYVRRLPRAFRRWRVWMYRKVIPERNFRRTSWSRVRRSAERSDCSRIIRTTSGRGGRNHRKTGALLCRNGCKRSSKIRICIYEVKRWNRARKCLPLTRDALYCNSGFLILRLSVACVHTCIYYLSQVTCIQ